MNALCYDAVGHRFPCACLPCHAMPRLPVPVSRPPARPEGGLGEPAGDHETGRHRGGDRPVPPQAGAGAGFGYRWAASQSGDPHLGGNGLRKVGIEIVTGDLNGEASRFWSCRCVEHLQATPFSFPSSFGLVCAKDRNLAQGHPTTNAHKSKVGNHRPCCFPPCPSADPATVPRGDRAEVEG